MIMAYYFSVKSGNRGIEDVPEKYRADVQRLLDEDQIEGE